MTIPTAALAATAAPAAAAGLPSRLLRTAVARTTTDRAPTWLITGMPYAAGGSHVTDKCLVSQLDSNRNWNSIDTTWRTIFPFHIRVAGHVSGEFKFLARLARSGKTRT